MYDEIEMYSRSGHKHEPRSQSQGQLNSVDRDRAELHRLGKKPVLRRNFGFMSMLGFSCTVLVTWEAILIIFDIGFMNGGPSGLIYGYLLVWAGMASTFASLSELASMAPTSAGQYHWASMLAPRSSQRFLSYITGWLTVWGWQAMVASPFYLSGTMVQGMIVMTRPTYNPKPWQAVLLFWASISVAVFVNAVIGRLLPKFEGFILILHILGFFAVLLPLVVYGPHQEASEVFNKFRNEGNWPTQGLSFMIGIVGTVFAFAGADGAIHMSEEIQNASLVVPRSIMTSIFINGSLGFGMLIATLFSIHDIDNPPNGPAGYQFMQIFLESTGSVAGATFMASIITTMQFCANVSLLASASRMCWSFARDRGLPGWRILQHVDPRTFLPIRAILVTTIISCLLSLIVLGSSTAFNDLVSLSVTGLYCSYLVVSALLLYRRCTGAILSRSSLHHDTLEDTDSAQLYWGPWHIPGVLGIMVNTFACLYETVVIFFALWPSEQPVTAGNMNYTVLVTGAVIIFSVVYYYLWGRKEYMGPVIEVDG